MGDYGKGREKEQVKEHKDKQGGKGMKNREKEKEIN